jgi:hypothetical protein
MGPNRVIKYIDKNIIDQINSGCELDDIISTLNSKIKIYKSSKYYIQVSESYLVRNWERIEKIKRTKTMLVIQSVRRVKDIKWLIKNQSKFQYDTLKMYNIILLKDKLMFNYSESSSNSNS